MDRHIVESEHEQGRGIRSGASRGSKEEDVKWFEENPWLSSRGPRTVPLARERHSVGVSDCVYASLVFV